MQVPRWASPLGLLLSVVGLGLATYLTIVHFDQGVQLVCSSKGVINCEQVTTSPQSYVFGIPVAVLGLAYFVGMIPWQLPRAWRSADPRIRWGRLAYCAMGILFVFYLLYAEFIIIGKICLWCTAVHVVTFLLFAVTGFATALSGDDDYADEVRAATSSRTSA
ncbi:MAG: vitamin K epoxide reductase family protein [Acidothermus sp.]|nr:vitamin K epoxide reductase family protein [Acidothermus sp.]